MQTNGNTNAISFVKILPAKNRRCRGSIINFHCRFASKYKRNIINDNATNIVIIESFLPEIHAAEGVTIGCIRINKPKRNEGINGYFNFINKRKTSADAKR